VLTMAIVYIAQATPLGLLLPHSGWVLCIQLHRIMSVRNQEGEGWAHSREQALRGLLLYS
jgi:hypothetical protein